MDSLSSSPSSVLSLQSPADMLAAIPYLFGFHPADSLIVLGLRAGRVIFQVRVDLPGPGEVISCAKRVAEIVARQRVTRALLAAYGTEQAADPVLTATGRELRRRRIDVPEALRATDGKYYSITCRNPQCCDPGGMPYDVSTSVVAATATAVGLSAVAQRSDVAARLDPIGGRAALAMRDAALRADMRLCALVAEPGNVHNPDAIVAAGIEAVDRAIVQFTCRGALDDDELAWLGLLLVNVAVRDHAWERVGEDLTLHVNLWTDVVRRIEPELAAPPATLLAFAAWRSGGGAIASIAVDRALDVDPTYTMARYLLMAFEHGLSPTEYAEMLEADGAVKRSKRRARYRSRKSRRR